MGKESDREKVLQNLSWIDVDWHDGNVLSAKDIADSTEMSRYKALKILHELRDEGLVERASQGCPAQVSYGEVAELECEAMPPLNGWALTSKGRETDIYKAVEDEYNRGLAELANGIYDEKDGDDNG